MPLEKNVDPAVDQADITGRKEIDRISESTNFNGIQLLDGTLGAREGAFTTARVGAVAGIEVNITDLLPAAGTAAANASSDVSSIAADDWHKSVPKKDEVKPEFAVDFADLNIKGVSSATDATSVIKVDLAGSTITLKITGASDGSWASAGLSAASAVFGTHEVTYNTLDSDNNGEITGDEIAAVVASIIGAVGAATGSTGNPAGVVQVATASGEAFYSVTADGDKLVFKFAGDSAKGSAASAKDPITEAMTALKGNIQVTSTTSGVSLTGNPYHAVTDIKEPVVGDPGYRAGIGMKIDDSVVADGVRLVIEDKTFVFRTNADSIVGADAAAGEVLIDVSAYASSTDQFNAAIKAMSQHTTANFTITALSSTAIWIDQTEESLAANNFYTELSDLTSLISANRGGKAAGLKVTMDASTLQDGDAVRIDGQTYQFVSKAGQADITGAKEIVLANIGDGLTNGELIDALIDNLPADRCFLLCVSRRGYHLPGNRSRPLRAAVAVPAATLTSCRECGAKWVAQALPALRH